MRDRAEPRWQFRLGLLCRRKHSRLSYRDATGPMAETVAIDCTVAQPASVSASALALHLDCSRTNVGKLEAEGVIQRQSDGFPLDQSRAAIPEARAAAAFTNRRTRCRQPE